MLIVGYDVSNVANVQTSVYEAFGHVELLPWITAIYPLKIVFFISEFLMLIGSILAGAATNINMVIIGRVITGFGSAGAIMAGSIFVLLLTTPTEYARYMGLLGVCWAVGLVLGPIVGGAFAQNSHATWRWAMYINIPFIGFILTIAVISLPSLSADHSSAPSSKLTKIDWIGAISHFAFVILSSMVLIFSGSTWDWGFGGTIAVWVITGVLFIFYTVQQLKPLFTTREHQIFPVALFFENRNFLLIFISTFAAGGSYGLSPISAAVRLLPYIGSFILSTVAAAILGAMMLAGAGGLSTLKPNTPDGRILGLDTLVGVSVGLIWQTGNAVMSRLVSDAPGLDKSNPVEVERNEARKASLRQDTAMIHLVSQLFGVSVALSCAGCVFQNLGYNKLHNSISSLGNFSDKDIRDALAGVDSSIFRAGQDPRVIGLAIEGITTTIGKIEWIAFAGGAITLIAGLCMKWEKLDFEVQSSDSIEEMKVNNVV
ncbi:major facilitator superfamily domain-containing protein [Trichoderma breve]|uniref:Major facilitator superfamily domain-containing protein n=1 Tax=Trichoderma breve TaxID=2034170 RepID=A0A9W9EA18_9HYPO|nr:major facilitator superfamily domain-containing protein [Trichoderma breve]KAJ4861246.1 major facilitator superfamily domain-containing protein [Trichoderma breve]